MEDVLQQIPGANQSQLGKHGIEKFFDESNSMLLNQTDKWEGSEET